jgi:hypothetical protein
LASDPPPGWTELQTRARDAKTPAELTAAIDEMNKLLTAYEKATGDGHGVAKPKKRRKRSAEEQDPKP